MAERKKKKIVKRRGSDDIKDIVVHSNKQHGGGKKNAKRKVTECEEQIADYKRRQRVPCVQVMKAMQEHFLKQRRRKRKNWLPYRKLMI